MRYLSVCSGIEAATSAWHHLGWEPVAFSEIEPFPSAVLKHHYPNVPNWGDMTQYKNWPDATIDLLVGGTPCQSFSVAGLRKGLEDPRGNLMLTFLGIADRYRPKYIVWENVPGVLSSNGGKDFGSFLGALGELGYGWAYRVLDAQWFGVAQRRRRVFVVGCLGDQRRAAEVLFESESVSRNTPPSRAKGQGATADVAGSPGSRGNKSHTELDGHGAYIPHAADTVTSKWAKGAEALQQGAQSGGNCIPVHAFKVRGGCEGGGKGYLGSDDTAFTVATHQDQQIAQPVAVGVDIENTNLTDDCAGNILAGAQMRTNKGMGVMQSAMQVRRLTPVECERLQGFPDNHTNIPWRKKAEAPDGPRYKALGNSMAVPVMRWIGERINA